MLRIFIDADACPVKAECYKVAKRHGLMVTVVANQWIGMPNDPSVRLEVVDDGFDAADNWIVEQAGCGDIVITDDLPLAARCLAKGARVVGNRGRIHDQDSIGEALANRGLMQYLREAGAVSGGQRPLEGKDKGQFLQALDKVINAVKKYG